MAEHPNVELIRRLVAARLTMDIKGLEDVLAKDVLWHIPGEGQWAGDIRGRDALIALWTGVADEGSSLSFDLHDVLANDEHAVALANVTMKSAGQGLAAGAIRLDLPLLRRQGHRGLVLRRGPCRDIGVLVLVEAGRATATRRTSRVLRPRLLRTCLARRAIRRLPGAVDCRGLFNGRQPAAGLRPITELA